MIKRIIVGRLPKDVAREDLKFGVDTWYPENGVHPGDLEQVVKDLEADEAEHVVFTCSPLLLNYITDLTKIRVSSQDDQLRPVPHDRPELNEFLKFCGIGEVWANMGDEFLVRPFE